MKLFVIGAGATFSESLALKIPQERRPPLMKDFTQKMWQMTIPTPYLELFLKSLGHECNTANARDVFSRLEMAGQTNVEEFFEFAWQLENWLSQQGRGSVNPPLNDLQGTSADEQRWVQMLRFCFSIPLASMMIECFYNQGVGWKALPHAGHLSRCLAPGDIIVNLNYDTVVEIALNQNNIPFQYAPHSISKEYVLVAKPHGSLNMAVTRNCIQFGIPEQLDIMPNGVLPGASILPPRLNKEYSQHPIAAKIAQAISEAKPDTLAFWGVGMTASDINLTDMYKSWARETQAVFVINPDIKVTESFAECLGVNVQQLNCITEFAT